MSRKRWRGTILFVGIFAALTGTVGARYATVGAAPAAQAGDTTGQAGSAGGAPSGATAADTTSGSAGGAGASTVTGPSEQTPYGPVEVRLTFAGSRITAASALKTPTDRGRSVAINSYATPILAKEVIASQSARIDSVSGATYTSEAYAKSAQAAIDAHG